MTPSKQKQPTPLKLDSVPLVPSIVTRSTPKISPAKDLQPLEKPVAKTTKQSVKATPTKPSPAKKEPDQPAKEPRRKRDYKEMAKRMPHPMITRSKKFEELKSAVVNTPVLRKKLEPRNQPKRAKK
jgi:hypothetical protein